MKAFFSFVQITIAEMLTYRANIMIWRARLVIRFLVAYAIWTSVFTTVPQIGRYTESEYLTLLVVGYVFASLSSVGRTQELASDIHSGNLSNALLRPFSLGVALAGKDLGEKIVNVVLSVIEMGCLVFLLSIPITLTPVSGWIVLPSMIAGMIIYTLSSTMISLLTFWTQEEWGPRFLFWIALELGAGSLFPPDLLPGIVGKSIAWSPFPFMFFYPAALSVGIRQDAGVLLAVTCIWIVVLTLGVSLLWNIGLKRYEAGGR